MRGGRGQGWPQTRAAWAPARPDSLTALRALNSGARNDTFLDSRFPGVYGPGLLTKEVPMATPATNLDALIPREDFEVQSVADPSNPVKIERVSIRDLEPGFFYNALRKPDFQRETANWSPAKVVDLVKPGFPR